MQSTVLKLELKMTKLFRNAVHSAPDLHPAFKTNDVMIRRSNIMEKS